MEELNVNELVNEIEDFELPENLAGYEVWLLGYDEDYLVDDFEVCLDTGYTELEEARKCFNYFSDPENLREFLQNKGVQIPTETKHTNLMLECVVEIPGTDLTECWDILNEVEVKL